jgi:hypothetical protein
VSLVNPPPAQLAGVQALLILSHLSLYKGWWIVLHSPSIVFASAGKRNSARFSSASYEAAPSFVSRRGPRFDKPDYSQQSPPEPLLANNQSQQIGGKHHLFPAAVPPNMELTISAPIILDSLPADAVLGSWTPRRKSVQGIPAPPRPARSPPSSGGLVVDSSRTDWTDTDPLSPLPAHPQTTGTPSWARGGLRMHPVGEHDWAWPRRREGRDRLNLGPGDEAEDRSTDMDTSKPDEKGDGTSYEGVEEQTDNWL